MGSCYKDRHRIWSVKNEQRNIRIQFTIDGSDRKILIPGTLISERQGGTKAPGDNNNHPGTNQLHGLDQHKNNLLNIHVLVLLLPGLHACVILVYLLQCLTHYLSVNREQ